MLLWADISCGVTDTNRAKLQGVHKVNRCKKSVKGMSHIGFFDGRYKCSYDPFTEGSNWIGLNVFSNVNIHVVPASCKCIVSHPQLDAPLDWLHWQVLFESGSALELRH